MIGAIIRKNRLEMNFSQTSLCQGICTVSYLSKIESGQVKANDEIIQLLLNRLDISINENPDDLNQLFHRLYEADYYARIDEFNHLFRELMTMNLSNSIYAIEYHFIKTKERMLNNSFEETTEHLKILEHYKPYFTPHHMHFYYYLKGFKHAHDGEVDAAYKYYEKACSIVKKGVVLYERLKMAFLLGYYLDAVRLGEEAYRLLIDEGNMHYAIEAMQLLASAYSNTRQVEVALEIYKRLLQFGLYLKNDLILYNAYYNIGATHLVNKNFEDALFFLKKVKPLLDGMTEWHWFMTHQKLVLCYIGLKEFVRVKDLMEKIEMRRKEASLSDETLNISFDWLAYFCDAFEPYDDPNYLNAIRKTYEASEKSVHHGYRLFYGKYLIEALKAQRRYKEALEIEEKIK